MGLLDKVHEAGAAICMVTHDSRFARFADRTIQLFDGRIVEDAEGSAEREKTVSAAAV